MAVSCTSTISCQVLADRPHRFPAKVVVACGMVSLVAVLGVFVILGVRPVSSRSRRTCLTLFPGLFFYPQFSDTPPFI